MVIDKPSVFFTGFPGFDCRSKIWRDILHVSSAGSHLDFYEIFSTEATPDRGSFTQMWEGTRSWGSHAVPFFALRLDFNKYCDNWLLLWLNHEKSPKRLATPDIWRLYDESEYLNLFKAFCESVPSEETDCSDEQKRFLTVAKKVKQYLQNVCAYCAEPISKNCTEWIASGMYVLICFFFQNRKDQDPLFFQPPKPYRLADLKNVIAKMQKELVIPPKVGEDNAPSTEAIKEASSTATVEEPYTLPGNGLHSPEPELLFDLFAHIHLHFQRLNASGITSFQDIETKSPDEGNSTIITPAEIHRKLIPVSRDFTDDEVFNPFHTGFLLFDEQPIKKGSDWYIRHTLRPLPYTTDGTVKTYHAECMRFEDDAACKLVLLNVMKDRDVCSAFPCLFSSSGSILYSGTHSVRDHEILLLNIDAYGHLMNRDLEEALASYDIDTLPRDPSHSFPQRKAISKFDWEYLNYAIINVETMQELRKSCSQDPVTGENQLSITVPCPCRLVVIKNREIPLSVEKADQLCLSGYLHDHYSMKKDMLRARGTMQIGALSGRDPQMAFQHGAYLKNNGSEVAAEHFLRVAAKENIPGAQFELAELLKNRGTAEDIAEAQQLIDALWFRGYRTYGATQSIDLFGEHTQGK